MLIDLVKHIDGIVHGGGAAFDVVEEPGLVVSVVGGGDEADNGVDGGGRVYGGYLVVRVGRHQVSRGVQQLLHHSLYLCGKITKGQNCVFQIINLDAEKNLCTFTSSKRRCHVIVWCGVRSTCGRIIG